MNINNFQPVFFRTSPPNGWGPGVTFPRAGNITGAEGFSTCGWGQIDLDPLGSRRCTIVRNKANQGTPKVSGIRDKLVNSIDTAEARACGS